MYVDIKDIKELAKIISLCRKKGVESFKISENGIELSFSPAPVKTRASKKPSLVTEEGEGFLANLTPEDKLFWSSPSVPDEKVAV
jgi:hypothetical protein